MRTPAALEERLGADVAREVPQVESLRAARVQVEQRERVLAVACRLAAGGIGHDRSPVVDFARTGPRRERPVWLPPGRHVQRCRGGPGRGGTSGLP